MKNKLLSDIGNAAITALKNKAAKKLSEQKTGKPTQGYTIGGRSVGQAFRLYKELNKGGFLKQSHFCVAIEPYNRQGDMAKDAEISIFRTTSTPFNPLWLLITSVDWPVFQAETDAQKVSALSSYRLTSQNCSEISITFLDNQHADVLQSLTAIAKHQFNPDGTLNLPSSYAIRMTPYLFDHHNQQVRRFAMPMLVALQSVQTSTSTAEHSPIELQTTWMQFDKFMR